MNKGDLTLNKSRVKYYGHELYDFIILTSALVLVGHNFSDESGPIFLTRRVFIYNVECNNSERKQRKQLLEELRLALPKTVIYNHLYT